MSFDLFYPNEGNAPRWQLITRLEQAAPPDSAIPDASVLNTVSIMVPSEQLRHFLPLRARSAKLPWELDLRSPQTMSRVRADM